MPAVAYKEKPLHRLRERPPERPRPQAPPRQKTFHARLIVTRVEEWFVEADNAEEARALFAAGAGHRSASGERVHVEIERLLEGAD